jgi:hypothetical protein
MKKCVNNPNNGISKPRKKSEQNEQQRNHQSHTYHSGNQHGIQCGGIPISKRNEKIHALILLYNFAFEDQFSVETLHPKTKWPTSPLFICNPLIPPRRERLRDTTKRWIGGSGYNKDIARA